jgi:glycerol-3-phosphate O-acyltransferase/dihydroxyacetone phosphate acyltransferase
MRHLLRARGDAVKALAECFATLQASEDGKAVNASIHLAQRFGWVEEIPLTSSSDEPNDEVPNLKGYRQAREVIAFLRARGAKVATLDRKIEGDWVGALGSEEEGTAGESDKGDEEDLVWVASGTSLKQEDD